MLAITGALALAGVCKLVSKSINKKVDTMFDDMADTRTQRFFFAFDGQPSPISVNEAARQIDETGGKIKIEGLYNQRPVRVTVKTKQQFNKDDSNSIEGHIYEMDCKSGLMLLLKTKEYESDPAEALSIVKDSKIPDEIVNLYVDDKELCLSFLEESEVRQFIIHLFEKSRISKLETDGNCITIIDENPQAGESFIRIKAIFEMQDHLAKVAEQI